MCIFHEIKDPLTNPLTSLRDYLTSLTAKFVRKFKHNCN